jgi:hypothetical protein
MLHDKGSKPVGPLKYSHLSNGRLPHRIGLSQYTLATTNYDKLPLATHSKDSGLIRAVRESKRLPLSLSAGDDNDDDAGSLGSHGPEECLVGTAHFSK